MTKKANTRKFRKLFLLFVVIFITSVVLVVETYAWFVGITTVNVSEFEVTVTGAQGLELSLNGSKWVKGSTSLTLSSTGVLSTAASNANQGYSGSGNVWPTTGLKPLSSAGIIDTTTGRLKLFEKSSLVSTAGGYRLIANQIDNYTSTEQDGYIAFDLFIWNGTDISWSSTGENVYLKKSSTATYSGTNHGAANSVRVGFFKLAAIKSNGASVANIQGLSCSTTTTGNYIKYCIADGANQKAHWNIWEPNYNVHVTAARTYFNSVCKQRNSTTGAYTSTTCSGFSADNSVLQTRAIKQNITASENVDIYDGLNGYNENVTTAWATAKPLMNFTPYNVTSSTTYSPSNQLIQLAGNTITKVRVYIWLEGQDVDNYDVIAGDSLKINFGFTKDRYGIENT